MAIFIEDSNLNIGKKALLFIDKTRSESTKNFLNTLFYLPLAGCGWMLWQIILKFDKGKVEEEKKKLKNKYENTTTAISNSSLRD